MPRFFTPTMKDIDVMLQLASQQPDLQQEVLILKLSKAGLRDDELVGEHGRPGLRVGDIDFDRKSIQIVGVMREPVTVDDDTLAFIRQYISGKQLGTHDSLVPLFKKDLRQCISDLAVKAGIIRPIKERGKRFLWAPSEDDIEAIKMTALALARKHKQMNHPRMLSKFKRNYLLCQVISITGIRNCEGPGYRTDLHPGIRVQDIDWDRKTVKIYPKGIGNYAKIVERELDDETLAELSAFIQQEKLKPDDRVFKISTRQAERIMKKLAVLAEHTIKRCTKCREITLIEDPVCPSCQTTSFEPVKVAYAPLFAPHRIRAFVGTKVAYVDKTGTADLAKTATFLGQTELKSAKHYVFGDTDRRRIFDQTFGKKDGKGTEKKEE